MINIDENFSLKLLQDIKAEDVFVFINSNREEFSKFLNWVPLIKTIEDEQKYITALKDDTTSISFAIMHNDQIIGSIGFICIDYLNKNAQIGYCLDNNFQGRGIVSKACKKLIEYGFSELGLVRIEFRVASDNLKSKAVVQRLSATFEGILKKLYFLNGTYVDFEIYSVLKD